MAPPENVACTITIIIIRIILHGIISINDTMNKILHVEICMHELRDLFIKNLNVNYYNFSCNIQTNGIILL